MPQTPVISASGEAFSRRAFRAVAISASFMVESERIVAIRSQVLGVRSQEKLEIARQVSDLGESLVRRLQKSITTQVTESHRGIQMFLLMAES